MDILVEIIYQIPSAKGKGIAPKKTSHLPWASKRDKDPLERSILVWTSQLLEAADGPIQRVKESPI